MKIELQETIFIIIILVSISIYSLNTNYNVIIENNILDDENTFMSGLLVEHETEIDKLEDNNLFNEGEIKQLEEEKSELQTYISNRDNTITARDKTIAELNSDMVIFRRDYQESKNKIEFPSAPYILEEINKSVLHGFLNEIITNDAYINLADINYKLTTISEIERFLRWDTTDEFLYEIELFDCDDFASRLYGQFSIPYWSEICFGMICSGSPSHVYNTFVTKENGELVLYSVEPQNDDIKKISFLNEVYFVIFS